MGEKEDKEKAEKLAAAKKRVAQLQAKKKKEKTSTAGSEKSTDASTSKSKTKKKAEKDDEPKESNEAEADEENVEVASAEAEVKEEASDKPLADTSTQPEASTSDAPSKWTFPGGEEGDDTATFDSAIKAASSAQQDTQEEAQDDALSNTKARQRSGRQQSISVQSKLRSTSFRQSPLSPTAASDENLDTVYRRQSLRIEELEKENNRLAKEAADGEVRWRKIEEELEELRERSAEQGSSREPQEEIDQLRSEVEILRRSQKQSAAVSATKSRSDSVKHEDVQLRKDLESKDSAIADLQLEISRLRSQLSSQTDGCETHGEQISALTVSLERAEATTHKLETELADVKKSLSRASEKAVLDGTERTSKETKIRALDSENESLKIESEDARKRMESLEKKIEAMNKLHRETEDRTAKKLALAESQAREAPSLRAKIESQEKDIHRLREARKRTLSGSGGNEGLDELEDEDRKRLEQRVRELEGEVFELRRGVWRDKRREMQPGMADDNATGGDDFDDVDLTGSMPASRRRSSATRQSLGAGQTRHSGFTQVISSGLAAFRGSTVSPDMYGQQHSSQQSRTGRSRNDSLLQEFDDDDDGAFDMAEFAAAQQEEEMKKMVEHVKEVKRGLKAWVGWRLDLVDSRKGGGGWGAGEIFEI